MTDSQWLGLLALVVGGVAGWIISRRRMRAEAKVAGGIVEAARTESHAILREARLQAQDELRQTRDQFEHESRGRRQEFAETEKRLLQRATQVDHRAEQIEGRATALIRQEEELVKRERELHKLQDDVDVLRRMLLQELQRVAGLSAEEAKRVLLSQLAGDAHREAAVLTRHILEDARQHADQEARRIITAAIERAASQRVQEVTSCILTLPSEEMKGRIIGREGRNIRAFEASTGVNVVIDDTPQTVVLSGFDPVRREVARLTMERLVTDGRINPARIEEEVAKVSEHLQESIRQAGEEAVSALGIQPAAPAVAELLGRLKFRHSYAQNVLEHSIEVARLAGLMAAELGLNVDIAKRVGLFHDLGKAVGQELNGSHAVVGAQLLKRHGEPEEVCAGVACHHHEVEPLTVYGMLVSAADAISASRPGARSESVELYLQRLEHLEAVGTSFPGVEKCFALQAGREIRVLVEPGHVTDDGAAQLARDIRRKIEDELQYPGQIKVTVIRETRTVEYAK